MINLCRNGGDCAGIGIPNYPANAPEFLGGDLGRISPYWKSGYDRQWVAVGTPPSIDTTRVNANSQVDYCYHSDLMTAAAPPSAETVWLRIG